ncbi:MAG TPA: hypothetical protein DCQ50_19795 [Chryseobacterium sp.]|nr:hypothetical protein [Chryseobacterium sp.]
MVIHFKNSKKMETKILEELKQIKFILSKITGTEDLPTKEKFSQEALDKAAKEYQDMVIKRGEWVSNNDLYKVSNIYSWSSGKFIIEKFGFNNYFQRGKSYYFNKKDLLALRNELKVRKIDLGRYMELIEDQEKFEKYISTINLPKGKNKKKSFEIPEELEEIETKPYLISEEVIKKEIEELKQEFRNKKLADYVDLYYKGTYGMFKYQYEFDKYLEASLKRESKNWCNKFNYANNALKKLKEIQKAAEEQT